MRLSLRALALLAALAAVAALLGLAPGTEALLYVAPALLLLVPLLHGRFPGEDRIAALAARAAAPARPRAASALTPRARRLRALVARGGRLLAASLAVRPPPAAPAR